MSAARIQRQRQRQQGEPTPHTRAASVAARTGSVPSRSRYSQYESPPPAAFSPASARWYGRHSSRRRASAEGAQTAPTCFATTAAGVEASGSLRRPVVRCDPTIHRRAWLVVGPKIGSFLGDHPDSALVPGIADPGALVLVLPARPRIRAALCRSTLPSMSR